MALKIFPDLDGLQIEMSMRPEFKTTVFESLSGMESRVGFRNFPKYTIKIGYEFLIENQDEKQLTALMGFINGRKGMLESFLFFNPFDNEVVNSPVGTGDGVTFYFPLTRKYAGITETVFNDKAVTAYFDGVAVIPTNIAVAPGLIAFFPTPPIGTVITWSGSYYYQVRLAEDGYDFTKISKGLYECKDIELIGSVRNLV